MLGLTPFNRNALQKSGGRNLMDFYNLFDELFDENAFGLRNLKNDTLKLDVKDQETNYLVEAEMPGIKKEEITLDYQDDQLLISVRKNEEINEEKENYIHRERRTTSMQRSIYLKDVKIDGIDAKLEDGVLKIMIPKTEVSSAKRQIEIK